jgi:uncharacterized protein
MVPRDTSPTMFSADPGIETPCTRVCVMHPALGLCLGCGRSLSEIARWIDYSAAERASIMTQLPSRLATLPGRSADARTAPATP